MADSESDRTAAPEPPEPVRELPEPLRQVLGQAANEGATDIHIDPVEDRWALRFRVDGVVRHKDHLSSEKGRRLVNEIKVVAEMELEHYFTPQEGHFRFQHQSDSRGVRVAIIPTLDTEAAHLRLLKAPHEQHELERLGMGDADHQRVRQALARSRGLVLIAGTTGTGKTTTLYALAAEAELRNTVAVSIEDPVEFDFPYLRQLEVDERRGLTMQEGLRILLRMDPDVLLIGEVRDRPSAMTAVRAALAGRLVLATVHAREAAGAIESMRYESVPDHVLGEALQLVIAQNLVRRVCMACRKLRDLRAHEAALFEQAGLTTPAQVAEPVGCEQCNQYGYWGRVGVFEIIVLDEELGAWLGQGHARHDIRERFFNTGARPLATDALEKAAAGITQHAGSAAAPYRNR